jgi:catechol 2,3-dioxygenase-like lactoylglutathione lyase family enzyme
VDPDALRPIQIGANTSDLPATLRVLSEAFGFQNAGATGVWGETIRLQGLSPDSRALIWWMVGAQPFFQFELFTHTRPAQRPKRDDWTVADHGWNRIGIAVPDLEACLTVLARHGIEPIGDAPLVDDGGRRIAVRDPFLAAVIELIERPVASSEVVYVANSVADLAAARTFYRDTMQLDVVDGEVLHRPEHEALWGLAGARRVGFVARGAGDVVLEVVQYEEPVGRPRPADHRSSDQGIVNVCLGSRDPAVVVGALERATAAGIRPPHVLQTDEVACGYLVEPGTELELVAIPASMDAALGFVAAAPFFG